VSAKHFTELIAWQLANELREQVIALTSASRISRDFRFCDQFRGAADSACANTAEGFGRFRPAEFARFLGIAKGSLHETQDHLHSARKRGYLGDREFEALWRLSIRAITANSALQRYLRNSGRHGPQEPQEPEEPQEP
jgi:four helix bundle protein